MRVAVAVCALGVVLLLVACGEDDEPVNNVGGETAPTEIDTQTQPEQTQPQTATDAETESETDLETETEPVPPTTSPEDSPGGAGDEEPARSLAQFIGRGGRITPRVVRVPPFISIRVELRSADGTGYSLDFGGGRGVATSPQVKTSSTQFDGLRPNERLVGRPLDGPGNPVVIVASAEPGP